MFILLKAEVSEVLKVLITKRICMIEILGHKYITEKEACAMIGYSKSGLQKMRLSNNAPKHIRLHKAGKVYYNKAEFESWIKEKLSSEE